MSREAGTHSQTPWWYDGQNSILDREGRHVMATANVRPEDVRQILACVNACNDLPAEAIEEFTREAGEAVRAILGRKADA